jgi:putative chitinase
MGNGPEGSGDGYRYRGRGFIQLTGKNNYQAFANEVGMSVEDAAEYLSTPEGAAMSAAWFWNMRNINPDADRGDVLTVTKKINGGTIGLKEREEYYYAALEIFA